MAQQLQASVFYLLQSDGKWLPQGFKEWSIFFYLLLSSFGVGHVTVNVIKVSFGAEIEDSMWSCAPSLSIASAGRFRESLDGYRELHR